jgi:hypothetical protein
MRARRCMDVSLCWLSGTIIAQAVPAFKCLICICFFFHRMAIAFISDNRIVYF